MKKSHFIVPALFTFAASFAMAADDPKDFDEVDSNKDGELNAQELRTALPELQAVMRSSSGATSSGAQSSASADAMMTREQIARALPEVEFDDERGPIDEDAYGKIVEALEERTSSPAGATGRENQSTRGASQSSSNSSSPRTSGSSPSQQRTPADPNPNPTPPQSNQ